MKHKIFILSILLFLFPITAFSGEWTKMTSGTTSNLVDVWGSSGSDVFAVGYDGTILHYNGSRWSAMSSGTTQTLNCVWGSSGTDVFVVGDGGTILHYDGNAWSSMPSGALNQGFGIWGSSGSDVFVVGTVNGTFRSTILHYNGSVWSTMENGIMDPLVGVWGSSATDVFIVGENGTILHYDGNFWSPMTSGTTRSLNAVWGSSESDVFAVSAFNILHYDGNSWSSESSEYLIDVWGSSGSDVFAVGPSTILHYDGNTWASMANPLNGTILGLLGIWGSSGNDVFAVGAEGTILHYGTGCPAKTVLGEGTPDITTLHVFRNELLLKNKAGKQYTALYYKHAVEISDVFASNPELKEKANSLVQKILPTVGGLLARRKAVIGEETVHESITLIDALIAQASPALEKDLIRLKQDIRGGVILKTFGVEVQKN